MACSPNAQPSPRFELIVLPQRIGDAVADREQHGGQVRLFVGGRWRRRAIRIGEELLDAANRIALPARVTGLSWGKRVSQ